MWRLLPALALLTLAAPELARAQDVAVAALAAPDAFTTPGQSTGLPQDLWRGASVDTLNAVLPRLAEKPPTGAAAALARRILATGAPGPQGVGADPAALAARARALSALGDAQAAAAVVARAPGLDRSAELSRLAAESALLAGDDMRACAAAEALTVGRDDIYWLRLRTYCQAIGGHADQAQLTFDLAQNQAKDPVFARLMGAKLAGAGSPGAPSLRNGLDYALSRNLGLDLAAAKPAPAVAAALSAREPAEPTWTAPEGDTPVMAAARAIVAGKPVTPEMAGQALDAALKAPPAERGVDQAGALIVAAWVGAETPDMIAKVAALATPEGRVPAGRNLAMEAAARQRLMGQTALLALWSCLDAPAGGLPAGERARIVRALRAAGLDADAKNFALEGLLGAP
jgi:hypothetical protein